MKIHSSVFSAIALFALLFSNLSTYAADPVSATSTHPLLQWLGLMQGCNKACDGRVNKSGARHYAPCPPRQICPEQPSPVKPGESTESGEKPGKQPPGEKAPNEAATGESALPPSNALASNYGAASGPLSSAPNMIGDQFGSGMGTSRIMRSFTFNNLLEAGAPSGNFYTGNGNAGVVTQYVALNQGPFVVPDARSIFDRPNHTVTLNYQVLNYNDAANRLNAGGAPLTAIPAGGTPLADPNGSIGRTVVTFTSNISSESLVTFTNITSQFNVAYDVNIPSPSGGVVGRLKIADDTSPMPRDRLIFDYDYFDGVPLAPGGVGVNRFTPGFEKTFFDGWMSFEMKIPMATTLDSTIVQDGVTNTSHGEFGNLLLTWKTLLLLHDKWAISGGLSVAPPTADDVRVVADGTPLVQVRNHSTHLGPFLGFLWTPNDRWFAQGFLQYDVAANGNPVLINQINPDFTLAGLTPVGNLVDTPFQYLDLGVGYWAYRGHDRFRRLTGWAFTTELHWNHSLRATDTVESGNWRIGDFASTIETFNLTLGTHIELYDRTTITCGYSVPLGGGLDREFNGELRLMVNRRFGPQNRLTQSTF